MTDPKQIEDEAIARARWGSAANRPSGGWSDRELLALMATMLASPKQFESLPDVRAARARSAVMLAAELLTAVDRHLADRFMELVDE